MGGLIIQAKYKVLEKKLAELIKCEERITELEKQIKYLNDDITLSGVGYDGISTSPTNKTSSSVENEVLSRSEEMDYLKHKIKQYKSRLDNIDIGLDKLDVLEYVIVIDRHANFKSWDYIASKVGYSKAYCQELRRIAVKSLL